MLKFHTGSILGNLSQFIERFAGKGYPENDLQNICSKITDGTHQPPHFIDAGIPFLLVSNIIDNKICYDTHKFISQEEYEMLIKRTPIEIGDILLTIVGSYGNPAIVEDIRPFCFQRHIAYLKPQKDVINSKFLHATLLMPAVRMQIDSKIKGIAQKTLNLSELKTIKVALPPIAIQNQFADFVQQTDKSKFVCINQVSNRNLSRCSVIQLITQNRYQMHP